MVDKRVVVLALVLVLCVFSSGRVLAANSPASPKVAAATGESPGAWAEGYVERMQAEVNANPELALLNKLESATAEAVAEVIDPWIEGWSKGDPTALTRSFSNGATGLNWATAERRKIRSFDGIVESKLKLRAGPDESKQYLSQFRRVAHLSIDVVNLKLDDKALSLTLRYDLGGETKAGKRRVDRGELVMNLRRSESGWKVKSLTDATLDQLVGDRVPAFEDVTAELGLDKIPVDDRKEAIRRGGYALACADYDNDGRVDFLVGNYGPVGLLKNTGGGFENVTKAAGIEAEGVVKSAAFADLDKDGDRDLVLLRFVVGEGDDRGDFIVYENKGDGTFTRRSNVLPKRRAYDRAMPLAMGDFDRDGNLDIYIGFPGIRDFTSGIANRSRPELLASQGIWFNRGNWKFEEAADDEAVVKANHVYAHAAVATDVDADGYIDLMVVDDSGRINPVYRNKGDGKFALATEQMKLNDGGLSMGITTGDFDNDGDQDIMSSNVVLTDGQRMAAASEGLLDPKSRMGQIMQLVRDDYKGLRLYENNGDATFTEVTKKAGIAWEGEAPAAGEWVDYNHDGLLDYYLPNGLWSSGEQQLDSLFFRAEIANYGDAILGGSDLDKTDPMHNDIHGHPVFEKDRGGPNPILTLLRNHRRSGAKGLTYSIAGKQRNALFRNNGNGTFTEVGYLENADRVEDGYIVAPVDFNNDGKQDLVLRNTDPAPGNTYAPVIALRNVHKGNTVTVQLKGTKSNADAIGLVATAKIGDTTVLREVRSVNGAVQAEPVVFIGLGSAKKIERLELRFPDGTTQVLTNVSPGQHVVAEAQGSPHNVSAESGVDAAQFVATSR